jgi:DNA-binding NarL/FixJ family response regulator
VAIATGPRVLIADDHAPTRAAVRRAVEDGGFLVCGEVADADGAIIAARETRPDVALLDVRMPGSGIYAAQVIGTEQPRTSIVMLTVSAEDDDLLSALSAGASGYLLKGQDPAKIPEVLRMVLSGEAALPATLVKRLAEEYRSRDAREGMHARIPAGARLTPREWEVLSLLNDGLATAEIGRRLFVADVTVRTHLAAIVRKLHVKDRSDALRLVRGETG